MCFGQVTMKSDQVKLMFETGGNLFNYFLESLYTFPGIGFGTEMVLTRALSKLDPNASNSNYNEISPMKWQ